MSRYWILWILVCVWCPAVRGAAEPSGVDLGPILSRDTDVSGNERWRALGPFIERRVSPDGRELWAVRPFYGGREDSAEQTIDQHVLWPIWTRRLVGQQDQWCFAGVTYWYDWDVESAQSHYALWVLPLYFQGRDERAAPYLAVFPLGGTIHDFLGQDELGFVLFPLVVSSRVNEVRTRAFLWPIVSTTTGNGIERFCVFPFYGTSKRRTDYEKHFIMWPFWSYARYGYERDSGYGYIIFPLFGHAKLDNQETWFVIPPLFRFSKGKEMNLTYCPWPLYQKTSGLEDKLYIWPLWGRKSRENRETWFVLWPLCLGEKHVDEGNIECRRTIVLPIVFLETRRRKSENESGEKTLVSSLFKLWPLMSRWSGEDETRLHVPSLWPFRDYEAIERNYAPFWTLYSHSRCGSVSEDELLWGLFRYRRSGSGLMNVSVFPVFSVSRENGDKGYQWSLLKGLFGYERTGDSKSVRLFYLFRIGGHGATDSSEERAKAADDPKLADDAEMTKTTEDDLRE